MKRVVNLAVRFALFTLLLCVTQSGNAEYPTSIRIGSKSFTESVILGELAAQLSRHAGAQAEHRKQLGGTRILWNALLSGEIHVYPEYTGTLVHEILSHEAISGEQGLRQVLSKRGVHMTRPLGFNNTYALGMLNKRAVELGIATISDLSAYPELKLGFSNEFMDRADGWPGLREAYGLPHRNVRGLDHNLAYRGLVNGDLDATDLYSTDAEIRYYDLKLLDDNLNFFPEYRAVMLYRADLVQRAPDVVAALRRLEGKLDQTTMVDMNAQAKLDRISETQIVADFIYHRFGMRAHHAPPNRWSAFIEHTRAHLLLVVISLCAAIVVSIPLGIIAARHLRIGQLILATAGIIQTIPSLALLVFMIPLLGIGGPPAILALFLYSLLPIVRNTYIGLRDISLEIRESAEALGLSSWARLRLVELPMAMPTILAGIKTSAVINVGTATLGALIGAGGYGQPILTGIRLDDMGLILQGAVPAAALALLVQGLFELAERYLVPKGLRL